MAQILATMHWEPQIDADDVEFVLGGSGSAPSTQLSDAQMGLLDFDCCQKMQVDAGGVKLAVAAFFRNDPYYPRFIPGDEWLWEVFKKEYLVSSTSITGGDITLAELLISSVEEQQAERKRRKQGMSARCILAQGSTPE
jgi:Zinc finger protein